MTVLNDLDQIEAEFLKQCGRCDAGLPTTCVCATRDYRPTMSALTEEVATLRRVMLDAHRKLLEQANLTEDYAAHHAMVETARDLRAEAGQ